MSGGRYQIIEDKPTDAPRYEIVEDQPASLQSDAPDQKPLDFTDKLKRAASIAAGDIESIPGHIGESIVKGLNAAPSEIGGVYDQLTQAPDENALKSQAPSRIGLNLAKSGENLIKGVANIPHSLLNYEAHLGLIPKNWEENIPLHELKQIPGEASVNRALGNQQPGDALIQNLPGLLGVADMIGSPTKGISKAVSSQVTGSKKLSDFATRLAIPSKERAVNESKLIADKAKEDHAKAVDQLNKTKDQSVEQAGTSNSPKMKFDIDQTQKNLDQLNRETPALNHLLENVQHAPESPTKDVSVGQQAMDATRERELHEQALYHANIHHENSQHLLNESENHLGDFLHQGEEHDVEAAKGIKDVEEKNRKSIGAQYDQLEENIKDKTIPQDNKKELNDKYQELNGIIKSGGMQSKEARAIGNDIDRLEKNESVSAKDYLTAYRSAKDYARQARNKAYKPGMNAEERADWMQKYQDLDDKVDEMGKTLESALGKDDAELLKSTNERWKNEVAPLHRNTTFQTIRKKGRISGDIINTLRGTEKGDTILKGIIKSNPEINRHVIGQRFEKNPDKIYSPNQQTQRYLDEVPETKPLIAQRQQALNAVSQTKRNLELAQKNHADSIKQENDTHKAAQKADALHDKRLAFHQKELARHQDELDKRNKDVTDHLAKIKTLEDKHARLSQELPALNDARKKVKQTLAQKLKAEKAYNLKKDELKNATTELKNAKFRVPFLLNKLKTPARWIKNFYQGL